jgi:glucuronide carrier protein/probable glucitol transport protein GutA
MFLGQTFQSAGAGIMFSIMGDTADYGEYVTGVRVDGFMTSLSSLSIQLGGAIGPAAMLLIIGNLGYVPNQPQNAAVIGALGACISLVVAVCCALQAIAFLFYDMDEKKHKKIREELEKRHAEQV